MQENNYNKEKTTSKNLFRATQIVWYILGLLEVLLVFRFLLKLLAANPAADFTNFIYSFSYPLVAPFRSVFGGMQIEGNVFEWTTLLAMLVYWVVAIGVVKLISIKKPISNNELDHELDQN